MTEMGLVFRELWGFCGGWSLGAFAKSHLSVGARGAQGSGCMHSASMRAEGRRDVTVLTVRNLDDETRAGLKQLGIEHGRSMEGEARVILAEAVRARGTSTRSHGIGSRINELFADLDWQGVERQEGPARAASFEHS
jgi:hypothetical protein